MSLTTVRNLTQEQRVERSHIDLMKTPAFVAYSGVLMVGSVKVESDPIKCPTAYTNGRNGHNRWRNFRRWMVNFPYSDCCVASLHLHDADSSLFSNGARKSLIVCLFF